MQVLDEGRVVVLERSIVKSNYSSFAPLPYENAPLHPYQASRDTDEHQNGHKKRKRSAYAPNQRELDFNARHAAVEPLLSSALLSLRTWMNTANSSTIPEALGISAPPSPAKIEKKERIDSPPPPDYIALSEMRRVTNPKFIWQDDIQEEQKEEEYDLFDHLISNDSNAERVGFAFSHQVIIPPRAAFFLSDFHSLSRSKLLQTHKHCFQCIILDPPWENRSVKRSSAYEMLPNKQLLGLPVSSFAAPGGCLVALWVTNREKLRVFIEEELLEAWGLRHVATWHWLKVAEDGQPLFPLVSFFSFCLMNFLTLMSYQIGDAIEITEPSFFDFLSLRGLL